MLPIYLLCAISADAMIALWCNRTYLDLKKRERNNWNNTFWSSRPWFSERIIQQTQLSNWSAAVSHEARHDTHDDQQSSLKGLGQLIAPPRLEQTPQKQHKEVQHKSLCLGLHQPIKEDWDPEGKLSLVSTRSQSKALKAMCSLRTDSIPTTGGKTDKGRKKKKKRKKKEKIHIKSSKICTEPEKPLVKLK